MIHSRNSIIIYGSQWSIQKNTIVIILLIIIICKDLINISELYQIIIYNQLIIVFIIMACVNIFVYILWIYGDITYMEKWFINNDTNWQDRPVSIILSGFSHKNFFHLIENLISLFYILSEIYESFGLFKITTVYIIGIVSSNFYSMHKNISTLGSSGAIYCLEGANLIINKALFIDIIINGIRYFIWNKYIVARFYKINHWSHLSGLLTGVILGVCMYYNIYEIKDMIIDV